MAEYGRFWPAWVVVSAASAWERNALALRRLISSWRTCSGVRGALGRFPALVDCGGGVVGRREDGGDAMLRVEGWVKSGTMQQTLERAE